VTFNDNIPIFDLPMAIAHYKAHQRGYAREDEATFIGYIACINSTEPFVRYSGYLYGLKVLSILQKSNVDRFNDLRSRLTEGPLSDLREHDAFWERTQNSALAAASRRVFSAYLRVNRVSGGVKNIDEDVPLIIGYYLKRPQLLAPGAEQTPSAGLNLLESQPTPTPTPERPSSTL
jgi:hypothetical protein